MSERSPRAELVGLRLGDAAERWEALGFDVRDSSVQLGGVELELEAEGDGIGGWRLRGVEAMPAIDGLATEVDFAGAERTASEHPNGAVGIDDVVVRTPDFDRTATALTEAGMPLRRVRDAPGGFRQGFRRLGPVILELVEAPNLDPGPARFWGLVVIVPDLEELARRLGDQLGSIKSAVQPGRQIATLGRSAGLGEAVAFMSPER